MKRIVVDASVAVKWFATEKGTTKALTIRDAYHKGSVQLVAPTLIYYEVTNALRFHPHYNFTKEDLLASMAVLKDLQIAIEPTEEMWYTAFEVSLSQHMAVYDAIYVAASLALDAELVTSDEKLLKKLSEEMKNKVTLLREFSF